MSNFSNKSIAREFSFKLIYKVLCSNENLLELVLTKNPKAEYERFIEEFINSCVEPDDEHPNNQLPSGSQSFALSLCEGVFTNKVTLEDEIGKRLHKRKVHQLEKIDYALLMLGTYEITSIEATPKAVVIDEMINLAKKFGSADSSSFINGTLDSVGK